MRVRPRNRSRNRLRNPAVVVNSETAGIGIIHALSRADVDIITAERNWPPVLGRFSRLPKAHFFYRPRHGETLVDCLLQLSQQFDGKGVLFPSTDADLEAMILAHDRLSERYHVPANREIGVRIFEKNWQYELAERTGVPIPRHTRFIGGESPDVERFRFPLILKPSSRAVGAGERVFRLQLLDGPAELERCVKEIGRDYSGRGFQIAENIPGEPDQLYTVGSYSNRDGRVLRSYTGRKITQYPYYHGMASVSESMALPERVVRDAQSLLEAARFHGISQVEFKYDARDGLYKLMEINGRSWLWVKLAAFSGVNLPLIQFYDLCGDPRLQEAVAVPQDDSRFFVFDFHVKLNGMATERRRIEELRRVKAMVPAIYYDSEWRLGLAHRALSLVKRLRHATESDTAGAG